MKCRCLRWVAAISMASVAAAQTQLQFTPSFELSEEGVSVLGGADPGQAASKGKIVRLFKTAGGARDGRLVVVYADANAPGLVWHPKTGTHTAKDVFARWSDDGGATWSNPVNLSNTANSFSAITDWDGDGLDEPYWGDSGKPNVFNSGDVVVVSWVDKYCPEESWPFGSSGQSTIQGTVAYPDLDVYPYLHVVPYSGVWAAISLDGGETWTHGGSSPPLQLTYGRRDAIQDAHKGAGKKWVLTWQEDPLGLQPGEGEGPGTGASGAKVTKGTDVWYTWTDDVALYPEKLRANRVPLTDHSQYDTTGVNGFPMVGSPGTLSNHGSSRANTNMVNLGGVFTAVVAYEETKSIPDVLEGKQVHYHAFPYDAPVTAGLRQALSGDDGVVLTSLFENARRVRFVVQPTDGSVPALVIFWKQGVDTQGAPSDILMKVVHALDPALVLAAPTWNMSTSLGDPLAGTSADPLEDARAHRAILRGDFIALGYTWTWNGPMARFTDLANYDFYVRRSLDGGATWDAPLDLSHLPGTRANVKEPRLVAPAKTGTHDEATFLAAWGTETNVYEGLEDPVPLDVRITRTTDYGATWEKVVNVGAWLDVPEFESQLRPNDDTSEIYAVWMKGDGPVDVHYGMGTVATLPATTGTLFCFGDGSGAPCPCGNASAPDTGEGCANATGAGALLTATGSTSVASDDLALHGAQMPADVLTVLFAGPGVQAGGHGVPLGEGLLCVGPQLWRLGFGTTDGTGAFGWSTGLAALHGFQAGDRLYLQAWYRSPGGPCGSAMNTTNAVEIDFLP